MGNLELPRRLDCSIITETSVKHTTWRPWVTEKHKSSRKGRKEAYMHSIAILTHYRNVNYETQRQKVVCYQN